MAHEDRTGPASESPSARIAEEIEAARVGGKLPCSAAFAIARALATSPQAVGSAADLMDVRLSRCQLGFFGYAAKQGFAEANLTPADIPEDFQTAVQAALNDTDTLSCAALWALAATYKVPRLVAGYVTESLGIHVTTCQLGAF